MVLGVCLLFEAYSDRYFKTNFIIEHLYNVSVELAA